MNAHRKNICKQNFDLTLKFMRRAGFNLFGFWSLKYDYFA